MKRILFFSGVVFVVLAAICSGSIGTAGESDSLVERANALRFEPGKKPPFLGIFAHTDALYGFQDMVKYMEDVIQNNPYIVGFAFRTHWRTLHPEKDRIDWEGLEQAIDTAASAGKLISMGFIPGASSPQWIYDEGVLKVGPISVGRGIYKTPVPWDPKFRELYLSDIQELAKRYADDPRVFSIELLGHNYNYDGEEMHAPAVDDMLPYGWTRQLVLEDWRFWIDQYDQLFPNKKLCLIVSQMYRGAPESWEGLSEEVTEYFVNKCQGRAYLQNHQTSGRDATFPFGPRMCLKFSLLAPNTVELARPVKYAPMQQGSLEMTVYKFLRQGNPFYLQLWSRDCEEPQYAKALQKAWEKYEAMTAEECKAQLIKEGLYVKKSSIRGGILPFDMPRFPPPGYPGYKPTDEQTWSTF